MWATRFYGRDVPADVELREDLIDRTVVDLVDAHLGVNYSYFGAIDKTLSGFVILDDEEDNYTLWDLRDSQQVYWQDHETRDVELRHDTLAGYLAEAESKGPRESRCAVSTAELCGRYQWLVWFYARPLLQDGVPVQTTDYLVRNAIAKFRVIWPTRDAMGRAFEREIKMLAGDPHLAIYWLLHAIATCDDELRVRTVAAAGQGELVSAFVARLGRLPLTGDLPIVPDFRARRALALTYGPFELTQDELAPACLRALEISPHTSSLVHALQVAGALDRLDAAPTLARILDTTPGVALLRALLDKRAGATSSRHADTLARLLVDTSEPWYYALEALWLVHELAYEGPALVAATRRLVARDRFHRRALQMAMRAASIAGQREAVDQLERDIGIADQISQGFQRVASAPHDWELIVRSISPFLRTPFAYRVLDRTELNKPAPGLALWAARQVVRGNEPLIGEAFARLDDATIAQVLTETTPDDALLLLAILDGPEPGPHDVLGKLAADKARAAIFDQLAPRLHEPALFTKLMTILERPARAGLTSLVWSRLAELLPSLDAKQAVRVARCLIAHVLRHPHPTARAAAAHALYRFTHAGAEPFLVDALTEYGVRHAAARTPDDPNGTIVDSLYASLAGLGAKRALAERLFAERRAYWRLGRSLADVWDAALHTHILAQLRERRDPRAAGSYAYVLRDFVQQREPLADLAALLGDWQGETPDARGFLHYALVVGIDAALALDRHDVVRHAHEAAAWIAEPPLAPDHHARGTGWTNPLDAPEVAAALLRVLAPAPEVLAPKNPKNPKGQKKRPAAKPITQAPTKTKSRAKPKPKPKPKAKAKAKAKANAKAKTKAQATARPKAKVKAAPKAKTKSKAKPKKKRR